MKNALIPVVTFIGLDLGAHDGGRHPHGDHLQLAGCRASRSTWPSASATGLSSWGAVIIIVVLVMIINLLVDISYAFLDPRIRYGQGRRRGR